MMYIANHNLNAEIAIGGISILVPNTVQIDRTNAVSGTGSLGTMSMQCAGMFPSILSPPCGYVKCKDANDGNRGMGTSTKFSSSGLL
jgi:hypothetical protein